MDRLELDSAKSVQNMIHRFGDDPIFTAVVSLGEKQLSHLDVISILILMNKFYPSFTYINGTAKIDKQGNTSVKWENLILEKVNFFGSDYFDLVFNVPVYVQIGNVVTNTFTIDGGIKLTHEYFKGEQKLLLVNIFPNVYVDTNYIFTGINQGHIIDQSVAASENRAIVEQFLRELELLLGCEILEFESSKISKKYLHKYGFKEQVDFDGEIGVVA